MGDRRRDGSPTPAGFSAEAHAPHGIRTCRAARPRDRLRKRRAARSMIDVTNLPVVPLPFGLSSAPTLGLAGGPPRRITAKCSTRLAKAPKSRNWSELRLRRLSRDLTLSGGWPRAMTGLARGARRRGKGDNGSYQSRRCLHVLPLDFHYIVTPCSPGCSCPRSNISPIGRWTTFNGRGETSVGARR